MLGESVMERGETAWEVSKVSSEGYGDDGEHSQQREQYAQSSEVRRKLKNEDGAEGERESGSVCDWWGEGLVVQDLEGLPEDTGIYSESPEESLMGFMPENSMIWYVFKRSLWLLYREWIWGEDPLGALTVSRREWVALWTGDNGNREKWLNSQHF